jgi:6-phospho-beta-glucosidase
VGIKVAVVGGGSTYTPELVDGLCDHEHRMVVDDLVLLDPSEERRQVVGGLSERILRARGWGGTFSTTTDRHAALEGADFVVVQLRIGGQAARHVDETLPVGYGCLGQETTGAGGLAKALRTVPVVLELAEETAERANPGAWFIDFTNPVGIVTQALLDDGHRAVGLCNVAIWAQRRLGHYLGVEPDDVEIEHVGLTSSTGSLLSSSWRAGSPSTRCGSWELCPRTTCTTTTSTMPRWLSSLNRLTGRGPTWWPSWRPSCLRSTAIPGW